MSWTPTVSIPMEIMVFRSVSFFKERRLVLSPYTLTNIFICCAYTYMCMYVSMHAHKNYFENKHNYDPLLSLLWPIINWTEIHITNRVECLKLSEKYFALYFRLGLNATQHNLLFLYSNIIKINSRQCCRCQHWFIFLK